MQTAKHCRFFQKIIHFQNNAAFFVSVNVLHKCTKEEKINTVRKAACLIIGKNLEKAIACKRIHKNSFHMQYALAATAQITFARRCVRKAFEKFPNY